LILTLTAIEQLTSAVGQAVPPPAVAAAQQALQAAEEQATKAAAGAAAAEKAATEATAALDAAKKEIGQRTAAAKQAAQQARRAKAAAERAAAEVPLARAAMAHTVKRQAIDDAAAAEAELARKAEAAARAASNAADAKTKADEASSEAAAAAKAAESASSESKAGLEKSAVEKASAAKAAADAATAAQRAADQASAENGAAQQALAERAAARQTAVEQAAIAKADSLGGLKPLAANGWNRATARHLLWRAGFGGTPQEVDRLQAMGLHGAVEYLVDYQRVPEPAISFHAYPQERPLPYEQKLSADEQLKMTSRRQQIERDQLQGFRAWWMRRIVESPRPLEEKLTLFWHGHFACQYSVVENSYVMYQQNEMFRRHASGHYGALLRGLVHDATMIRYLNNNSNVKGHPNENLAREIMELFSMGTGHYSEQDIREASRALTGYTFDWQTGEFRFVRSSHDDGAKTIWGQTGNYSGDDLVDLILGQPATARFMARKFLVYFAYEEPDDATVERLASVLRRSNYNLSAMLENLFLSQEFYSPRAMATQIKSPAVLVAGTLRSVGAKEVDYSRLDDVLRGMGQDLLEPPNVKGWDGGRTWINADRIFRRYNAIADLVENRGAGGTAKLDLLATVLAGKNFQSSAEAVAFLADEFLLAPLPAEKRKALSEYAATLPPPSEWSNRKEEINNKLIVLLVMLMSSPEYQVT
jgi:uncharacterized protein (DUF1800 family)